MRIMHVGDDFAALRPCGLTLYSNALMQAQSEGGHEVSYFFSGRRYPRMKRPRVRRWRSGRVRMYELLASPINRHPELGTRHPMRDLDEPSCERAFDAVLRRERPELVHVHEFEGLPSSLIELAKRAGAAVVMTLHDYKPLCASVRLIDADGQICRKHDVGADCSRNCARAPDGHRHLVEETLRFERSRIKRALRVDDVDFSFAAPVVTPVTRALIRGSERGAEPGRAPAGAAPAEYQRRRDLNVERLALCDRLIAPSRPAAEVFASLGVERERLRVQRLTLPHLETLRPSRGPEVGRPLTFATLGGCASPTKGSRLVLEALQLLEARGRGGDYRFVVLGHTEPAVKDDFASLPAVELAGPYSVGDLPGLLASVDVGVFPSTWEETHGFVGIEMLAMGLPVMGSALGGITEYVRDGETGWLNRSVSGAGLADLMEAAMDDPAEVERLRRSVRERRGELVRPLAEHLAEVETLYLELAS